MRRTGMDCSHVRRLLDEYFEGTLALRQQEQVAAHLEGCARCAAELRQIERVAAALAAAPKVVPSEDLVHSISARAAELPSPSARRAMALGWRRLGLLAAGCIAVLGIAHYVGQLIWPESPALIGLLVSGAKTTVFYLGGQLTGVATAASALWEAVQDIGRGLVIAGKASAPVVGLYAAAETAVVVATVLVIRRSRRGAEVRLTLLV